MHVRPALETDGPTLVGFAHAAEAELGYRDILDGADYEQARQWLLACGVVFVVEHAGQVIGCLAATVFNHQVSGRLIAQQALWYVTPTYRHTRASLLLVRALEDHCLTVGITLSILITPVDRARRGTALSRRGYTALEVVHVKAIAGAPYELSDRRRQSSTQSTGAHSRQRADGWPRDAHQPTRARR